MASRRTRELRLAMAKDMLLFTNLPIIEIARRLGFTNEGDFRASFRRECHTTPIRWRNGHHLYNPNLIHSDVKGKRVQVNVALEYQDGCYPAYKGIAYLAPTLLSPIENVCTLSLGTIKLIGSDGIGIMLQPPRQTHIRPALHRIDATSYGTRNSTHYEASIAMSTRNYTMEVSVASPQPIVRAELETYFKFTTPILPEGVTLWSAPHTAK